MKLWKTNREERLKEEFLAKLDTLKAHKVKTCWLHYVCAANCKRRSE